MHYLILLGLIGLGAGLRFWNLETKPLWMDEVITALFSLGHSYNDVPVEQVLTVASLEQIFQLNPTATCASISQTIAAQSVHPPLFFCGLHHWVSALSSFSVAPSWVWQIRALPAIAGVMTIGAVYILNRTAFSKRSGLLGALIMAVSPFAVYLSQEARHYTVPMLLVTIALIALIQVQQDLRTKTVRPPIWIGWIAVNGIGFYVHYFFILAAIAQVMTLLSVQVQQRSIRQGWITLSLAFTGLFLSYLPGLQTFVGHMGRSETDWLMTPPGVLGTIAPLYQLAAGWMVMTIALPTENQPLWIAIPSGILMLVVVIGFGFWALLGLKRLWSNSKFHWQAYTLASFIGWSVLEFLAIVYLLHKDLTQVPRYNFIYFPAVCALMGASLNTKLSQKTMLNWSLPCGLLLTGTLSSIFVVHNLVFLKPYQPDVSAQKMTAAGHTIVVMSYNDYQDIALGLGFGLELARTAKDTQFALLSRKTNYGEFWKGLAKLDRSRDPIPNHLWTIAPELKKTEFPPELSMGNQRCTLERDRYFRLGIPYQGYRCQV